MIGHIPLDVAASPAAATAVMPSGGPNEKAGDP